MSSKLRVPVANLCAGSLSLPRDEARYVSRVHRKTVGDELLLFDPARGLEARAKVVSADAQSVDLRVAEPSVAPDHSLDVTLISALGKGDKPEQAVRDATALGARRVVFISAERTVSKAEGLKRSERYARVAVQVARQCGRGRLPIVDGPVSFAEAIKEGLAESNLLAEQEKAGRHVKLVCGFTEDAAPLVQVVAPINWQTDRVTVMVGPEGGFSSQELEAATLAGYRVITLGPLVLRAELACTFVLSTLRALSDARQSLS